jgi:hypothetical protein
MEVVLPRDEVRPSSRGGSSGITIPGDMRDVDQRPSMLVMVTLQMMMPTGHPLEHRSSKHGRSTCYWMMGRPPRMEGHPSTLGRSPVETMNTTLLSLEARAARQVGSGRIVSVPGTDTLGPRTWQLPWRPSSHVGWASKLRNPDSEGSSPRQRSLDARRPWLEGHQGRLEALPIDDATSGRRSLEVTAAHNRATAIVSHAARHRRLLPDLRRDRSGPSWQ